MMRYPAFLQREICVFSASFPFFRAARWLLFIDVSTIDVSPFGPLIKGHIAKRKEENRKVQRERKWTKIQAGKLESTWKASHAKKKLHMNEPAQKSYFDIYE